MEKNYINHDKKTTIDTNKVLWNEYQNLNNIQVNLVGWVRANRESGSIGFISLNDGSTLEHVQIVYKKENIENYDELKNLSLSASIKVQGIVVVTPQAKQPFEIRAEKIQVLKKSDIDYPIQKKHHSNEFLRSIAHLRGRTNKFYSIMKIRSELSNSIFEFFKNNDFTYIHSPIITSNDSEGAGEFFQVDSPFEHNFFGKKALLTVTGQMAAEAYAQVYKRVFTFGPTFRAEKSHTNRHLSEFWMLEPEMAFTSLDQLIKIMELMIKHSILYLTNYAKSELQYCNDNINKNLISNLKSIVSNDFAKIEYKEVIEHLKIAVSKGVNFENKNIYFGMDLGTEHERYICEKVFNSPVFVINYPKETKAFYMKQNNDGITVAAVDLLVPGVGELCGGSQREDNYQKLMQRCRELNIDISSIQWYLDLRKYGYYASSGFGLGFDRLVMYLTGIDNIRDAIPFPRVHGQLDF
ncbi:asparagine--tRNA ligase [Mycoplasmoides pirum]|uniref:asparagine--tRNA ligase n=1 Tax=Mycoplasmoides pirum TaxID=2122 RepID=UPI000698DCDD|nr:asparagine--tRNA ligase [Mycoplasmoides pirum]